MKSSEVYDIIYSMYKKYGAFPPASAIARESGCSLESIDKCLEYFADKGKIVFQNNQYWFPDQLKNKDVKKIKNNHILSICKIISGVVGISCIICSIRFTDSFNRLTMPKLWAFILSSALVIFNSFCFTIREYLKESGKKFQANLFIVLYIMGVSYSIFTAIAGQYNDYLINNKIVVENKIEEISNNKKYELLSQQKERYLEQIESYKNQIIPQQKIIDNLSESPERKFEYNNTWKQTNSIIEKLNNEISELENKISEIDSQIISSTVIENNNQNKNIFDWISDLFKISPDLLQFIISLFPAIFIDFVSPFAIMFAFYKNN